MSESQTPDLLTILEEWQLLPYSPPMWRCTWKNESGTVIRTWETENVPFYLPPTSSPCETGGLMEIPAEVYVAIRNSQGGAT